jgi:hypothetical protein
MKSAFPVLVLQRLLCLTTGMGCSTFISAAALWFVASAAINAQGLFTVLGPVDPGEGQVAPLTLGYIAPADGFLIHIVELGIGGDADAQSGPVTFSALSDGMDFSWSAGQASSGATYALGATPEVGLFGARGFVYSQISEWAGAGAAVEIRWHGNIDPDGYRTYGSDKLGNFYDDPGDSSRAWLRYELVPVPEPSTLTLAACAILVWALKTRCGKPARSPETNLEN